jgi:hypothetical protein
VGLKGFGGIYLLLWGNNADSLKTMRLILTILLSGNFIILLSQSLPIYGDLHLITGVVGDNSSWQELIRKRECMEIAQYSRNQPNDSIELLGRAEFVFLNNGLIQMRSIKGKNHFGKTSYWKWIENKGVDEIMYLDECNKRGILKNKNVNLDFETTAITINTTDSVVDKVKWRVQDKDTTCRFLHRWIYRQDTLVEAWYQWMAGDNCSWVDQKNFEISKFSYVDSNTITTERFKGDPYQNKRTNRSKTVKLYNDSGRLIYRKESSLMSDPFSETRYFYTEGLWSRTEYWYNDVLMEVFKRQPLTSN